MTRHSNSSRDSLIPPAVIRQLANQLVSVQTDVDLLQRVSRSTRLGHSSIDDGYLTIRDGDGLPRGYVGIQPDGTSGVRAVNGPPPPRPNTPELTGIMDGILVSWNGTFADTRPLDFAYLNVYVSGAGPSFIEGPSNLVTQFTEAGDFPVTNLGVGTYWCRFVAYNTSGKASEPSLTASATSLQVVAQDILDGIVTTTKLAADAVTAAKIAANAVTATKIADDSISSPKIIAGGIQAINLAADSVSAGKIAADAVTAREIAALTITAAEIAANSINATHITAGAVTAAKLEATLVLASRVVVGAAGGDRVELHPTTGIEQWLSGSRTLSIPPSGSAAFSGKVTVGAGIGVGPTIVVDPALGNPRINLYPSTTSDRYEISASVSARPGGAAAGLDILGLNAAGQTNGLALSAWSTNVTIGQRNTAGASVGGNVQLQQTGQIYLGSGGAQVTSMVLDGSGAPSAINTSGNDLYFDTGTGSALRLFDDGTAQLISGSAVKAFVIQHPTEQDRWLVHGCTESPDAEVQYRGEAVLTGGSADVVLPGYFEDLVRADSRTAEAWVPAANDPAAITPRPVKATTASSIGAPISLRRRTFKRPTAAFVLYRAAASVPSDGRFRIVSDAPDGTVVHWRVTAARRIAGGFDVEPAKSEVRVAGDGPYRYIIPNVA